MTQRILVTGGTGYIGSHTCVELVAAGYEVTILDNLCNSRMSVLDRLEKITNLKLEFLKGDVRDSSLLDNLFSRIQFTGVIHICRIGIT